MSRRTSHRGPLGLHKGNSLTKPPQGMASWVTNPPASPVVETTGISVSRHAEFIFEHFGHPQGPYMAQLRNTLLPGADLTYREDGNSRIRRPTGQTPFGHTAVSRCSTFGCTTPKRRLTCLTYGEYGDSRIRRPTVLTLFCPPCCVTLFNLRLHYASKASYLWYLFRSFVLVCLCSLEGVGVDSVGNVAEGDQSRSSRNPFSW